MPEATVYSLWTAALLGSMLKEREALDEKEKRPPEASVMKVSIDVLLSFNYIYKISYPFNLFCKCH